MSTKHTTTTRRAFLASVPAVAATLTPAAATALGGLAPSLAGDAELLALGAQFEPLFAEWHRRQIAEWGDHCEIESRTKAALGPAVSKPKLFDHDHPYYRERSRIIAGMYLDNDDDGDDCFFNRIRAFADEALSWEAETLEGLGFQVRVMMCAYPDIWDPGYEDEGPDDPHLARIVEDICRLCGIKFPPFERTPAAVTFTVEETPPPPPPPTLKDDPLLAAIKRHAEALKAYNKFFGRGQDVDDLSPSFNKAEKKEQALAWKLVETKPTTIGALIILMTYIVELEANQQHGWNPPENRRTNWTSKFHEAVLDGFLRLPGNHAAEMKVIMRIIAKEKQQAV